MGMNPKYAETACRRLALAREQNEVAFLEPGLHQLLLLRDRHLYDQTDGLRARGDAGDRGRPEGATSHATTARRSATPPDLRRRTGIRWQSRWMGGPSAPSLWAPRFGATPRLPSSTRSVTRRRRTVPPCPPPASRARRSTWPVAFPWGSACPRPR